MALLEQLDFENAIIVNQSEIARDLDMQRQNVNKAIKRLIKAGALLEGPRLGMSRSYQLNPYFGWKGSPKSHSSALEERMKEAGLSVVEGNKPPEKST